MPSEQTQTGSDLSKQIEARIRQTESVADSAELIEAARLADVYSYITAEPYVLTLRALAGGPPKSTFRSTKYRL